MNESQQHGAQWTGRCAHGLSGQRAGAGDANTVPPEPKKNSGALGCHLGSCWSHVWLSGWGRNDPGPRVPGLWEGSVPLSRGCRGGAGLRMAGGMGWGRRDMGPVCGKRGAEGHGLGGAEKRRSPSLRVGHRRCGEAGRSPSVEQESCGGGGFSSPLWPPRLRSSGPASAAPGTGRGRQLFHGLVGSWCRDESSPPLAAWPVPRGLEVGGPATGLTSRVPRAGTSGESSSQCPNAAGGVLECGRVSP